jgi:NAD(P)-dependent dehydrogenase (short-subunit alcohol dehydrogenase family)
LKAQSLGAPNMKLLVTLLLVSPAFGAKCAGYTTASDVAKGHDMSGKVVLITGGDSGIGFEAAKAIAGTNGTVVIASLSPKTSGAQAKKYIYGNTSNDKVDIIPLDLSSFASVHQCAEAFLAKYATLDVLINDAGIDHNPSSLAPMTMDKYERVFQVNYLGHFLLTELLLPALRASATPSRVVNVASGAHAEACTWAGAPSNCLDIKQLPPPIRAPGNNAEGAPTSNYGITKFLQIYHAKELAIREKKAGSHVEAFSLEPGFVDTPMTRNLSPATHKRWCGLSKPCPLSAPEGGSTPTFLALSAPPASEDGAYFSKCQVGNPKTWDISSQQQLFDLSLAWSNATSRLH